MGDFNDITKYSEKERCRNPPAWLLNGFCDALADAGLEDLGMNGYQFTWERGLGQSSGMVERLDKAVATRDWRSRFPDYRLNNLGFFPQTIARSSFNLVETISLLLIDVSDLKMHG